MTTFTGATAIAVSQESSDGGIDALESHLKAPDNAWDLVELRPEELVAACADGLLEKLDFSAIGGKDHYLPQAVSDCGVGAAASNVVLAWDVTNFPPRRPGRISGMSPNTPASAACRMVRAATWRSR